MMESVGVDAENEGVESENEEVENDSRVIVKSDDLPPGNKLYR